MEHIREEQLALYAAGDLAPHDKSATAAHVQNCGTCQAIVAGFHEVQDFVSSALLDPAADELMEVRDGIRIKLRERRSWAGRGWAAWAAVAAAAAAMIFFGIEHKPITAPQPVPPVAQLKPLEMPHLQIRQVVLHKPRVRHRDAGIRSVDLIARADQPPLIKMTTADPNVVILWQSNEGVKNE